MRCSLAVVITVAAATSLVFTCGGGGGDGSQPERAGKYGIYSLDRATGKVDLLYSTDNEIGRINENGAGTKIVFQENFGPDQFTDSEICMINSDGTGFERLTDNTSLDAYPSWSPAGTEILYLSWPDYPANTMDIYTMDADGKNPDLLYDSGFHDGDCSWVGTKIVFTREYLIWIMDDDGTDAVPLTDYSRAGEIGSADLPFGDYDPRLNPAGTLVSFERMVDDQVPSGNYDFYTVSSAGTGETAITSNGDSQFLAEWSHAGDLLVYMLAADDGQGVFDLYTMNPNGSNNQNITPGHWPQIFLCNLPIFSHDDSKIYFVGLWYSDP